MGVGWHKKRNLKGESGIEFGTEGAGKKEKMWEGNPWGSRSGRRGKEGHHLKSNGSMAFQKELKHLS